MIVPIENFTIFFAGLVLVVAVLRYNDTQYEEHIMNLVDGFVEPGLGFLFIFYALNIYQTKVNSDYKTFIYIVGLGSIFLSAFGSENGPTSGWDAVGYNVARPLAASSMLVLPLTYFS
jgi:hypothetical protein